jgi:hypothetical protein
MPRAKKHPKLSADERAFLNRLDCLNEEEIKQLTTRKIFAYFKIIDPFAHFLARGAAYAPLPQATKTGVKVRSHPVASLATTWRSGLDDFVENCLPSTGAESP